MALIALNLVALKFVTMHEHLLNQLASEASVAYYTNLLIILGGTGTLTNLLATCVGCNYCIGLIGINISWLNYLLERLAVL